MKKIYRMLISIAMTLTIICGIIIPQQLTVFAASASFSISVSQTSINVGDSVTVTVSLSCGEAIGAYSYCVSYDSSILEYTSGSGNGGGGTITYAGYGDGSSTSAYATYTFNAVGSGNVYIQTSSADVYTWNEEHCDAANAGASISVIDSSNENTEASDTEEPENSTNEATSENSGDTTEEDSEDSEDTTEETADTFFLKSLKIKSVKLSPKFSKDVFEYEAKVPSNMKKLDITAEPEDENSLVSITGNENFEPGGSYNVEIIVTSENGSKQAYVIKVTCEKEVSDISVIIDGTTYYFTSDYSTIEIPEGFEQEKGNYNGNEIITYRSPNHLISCVYLKTETGDGGWYIIDLSTGELTPMIQIQSSYLTYIFMTVPDSENIPDGYTETSYELGKNKITAYKKNESDTVMLVYAMNTSGDKGWYLYDTLEGTFIHYNGFTDNTQIGTEKPAKQSFWEKYNFIIMLCIAIALFLLSMTMIIVVIVLKKVIKEYVDKYGVIEDEEANANDKLADKQGNTEFAGMANPENAVAKAISPTISSTASEHNGPLLSNPLAKNNEAHNDNGEAVTDDNNEAQTPPVMDTANLSEIINIAQSIVNTGDKE